MYLDLTVTAPRLRRVVLDRLDRPAVPSAPVRNREVDAAWRLGLDASFVADVPAPVDAAAAIRYDDQAHFHPREYLFSLLDDFERRGGRGYENTRVTDVETGSPHRLRTAEGRVVADDVVVATHYPFYKRLLYSMRTLPGQEHILP